MANKTNASFFLWPKTFEWWYPQRNTKRLHYNLTNEVPHCSGTTHHKTRPRLQHQQVNKYDELHFPCGQGRLNNERLNNTSRLH
jgi:hypothetical protein